MRGMSWHVERDNQVLSTELIKFRTIVTAMPIQDQESISADCTGLGVLVEYLFKPDQSQLVICPSIFTGFNPPIVRQAILIPGSLVQLPLEDYHWWQCP